MTKPKNTMQAILNTASRADCLHSFCRAMQDTAQQRNDNETDRDTVNRLFELSLVLEEQIDALKSEIETLNDISAQEQKTARAASTDKQPCTE